MKMTTPIPEGINTPGTLETSIGTLKTLDGVADKETTQMVFDNLDRRMERVARQVASRAADDGVGLRAAAYRIAAARLAEAIESMGTRRLFNE